MAETSPNRQKTLGKGEIARYEKFLLYPQCFQKTCSAGLVLERVKVLCTACIPMWNTDMVKE